MSFAYLTSTPGLKFNYSLYAIPAGWVVSMAPLWWAIGTTNSAQPGAYNNALPQDSWKNLDKRIHDETLRRRISRAVAANNNGHTNLAIFAASLAAANAAHVSSKILHLSSLAFLATRIAYNFAYVLIDDPDVSYLRSGLFLAGVGSCLTLAITAAIESSKIPW